MSDLLRERFDALRAIADNSDSSAGLRDVQQRRTRRTRTRVAVACAASVAALALGGVLVFPQLTSTSTTSASGGQGQSAADAARGAESAQALDQPLNDPTSGSSQPPAATPPGPFSVTPESLLTWPEIQAVGEGGPGTIPYAATLAFLPLCGTDSSASEYSGPVATYSAIWTVSDGSLSQSNLGYDSDKMASDALSRLIRDAENCPVANEFASIRYTGSSATDSAGAGEVAYFDLRLESGLDGTISTTAISVTRTSNVLVEIALDPDGPTTANAANRLPALAAAAVDKIMATG